MASLILTLPIILISITLHEYSHGWIADKLGDPTPKNSGRLTLNPFAHLDLFGTVILPILLLVTVGLPLGAAKPVPINPYYFKNSKKGMMWVGIAGPLTNFLIALFFFLLLGMTIKVVPLLISQIIFTGITLNLVLGTFNLIPIPPLDGSRIVAAFLPNKLYYRFFKIEKFGFFIIILLLLYLFKSGLFDQFISRIQEAIISIYE